MIKGLVSVSTVVTQLIQNVSTAVLTNCSKVLPNIFIFDFVSFLFSKSHLIYCFYSILDVMKST